jgi:hypothetical protein
MTKTKPKLNRDGTVTYWSVYSQQWRERVRSIPDRELAAMSRNDRSRVTAHLKKASSGKKAKAGGKKKKAAKPRKKKAVKKKTSSKKKKKAAKKPGKKPKKAKAGRTKKAAKKKTSSKKKKAVKKKAPSKKKKAAKKPRKAKAPKAKAATASKAAGPSWPAPRRPGDKAFPMAIIWKARENRTLRKWTQIISAYGTTARDALSRVKPAVKHYLHDPQLGKVYKEAAIAWFDRGKWVLVTV